MSTNFLCLADINSKHPLLSVTLPPKTENPAITFQFYPSLSSLYLSRPVEIISLSNSLLTARRLATEAMLHGFFGETFPVSMS